MRYWVKPRLYAAGTPDSKLPVFVTANYKMSFDRLRGSLAGRNRLPAATPMGQRLRPFNQECTGTSAGVQRELDALSKRRSFHHIDKGVEVMHILPIDSEDPHSLAHTGPIRRSSAIDPQDHDSLANCFVYT